MLTPILTVLRYGDSGGFGYRLFLGDDPWRQHQSIQQNEVTDMSRKHQYEPAETHHEEQNTDHLSRRKLMIDIASGALASGLPACAGRELSEPKVAGLSDPLYYSGAQSLADSIRSGDLASEEVVNTLLRRIEEVNPALNAVVQLAAEAAIARAREADISLSRGESWGPLHGVPMTIKDSLDTAGVISTGGTMGRASFVPEQDATVVARLRDAGAILLGKTNTPEPTLSFETDNLVYGRTNNPYAPERTSGGSSGGAAAIVAAGGSPFDIGSDYGGSIRLPAHFCGIAGIKPGAGRVPRTGHIYPFGGLQDSLQQIGPLARYVDDLMLLLPLIMGPDWIDPGVVHQPWSNPREVDLSTLRVSFHTDNGVMTPTPETVQTVNSVMQALASQVATVEERRPAGVEQGFEIGLGVYFWDGGAAVSRLLRDAGTTEHTLQESMSSPPAEPAQLDQAIADWYDWRSRMLSFMADNDVIVCPVNALPAVPHGAAASMEALRAFSYTMTYNLTGWPGVVVRAGTSPEGLPIGVQIVTRPGQEDVALAVAKSVETSLGGFQPPPL